MIKRIPWLLPLLAALIAYSIAPWGDLVWDDQIVVKQQMLAFKSLDDVLRPPPRIPQWSYDYYRPATLASYLLDIRLFGLGNAPGAHAANVVYHTLTTLFLWMLLQRLLRARPGGVLGATMAATLFALHPIHTESVSWVTGRSDLLATMLLLPALHLALIWRDRGSLVALALSPLLYLLALSAKEVALAGLAIVPALMLLKSSGQSDTSQGGNRKQQSLNAGRARTGQALAWLGVLLPWAAVTWYYFTLRGGAGSGIGIWPNTLLELVWNPLQAAAWYLIKLIVPWPQSNFVVADMLPATATVILVLTLTLLLTAWSAIHWRRTGDGTILVGLWWTGIALAPSLAVTFAGLAVTPVAERYLLLPSAGAALAFGALFAQLSLTRWARLSATLATLLAIVYLAGTIQRGFVWLSDVRLWTDATAKTPDHGIPWVELGKARMAVSDPDGAIDAFVHARSLQNTPRIDAIAEFNLGAMYAMRGQVADARKAFEASLAANPKYARAHYGLGRLLYEEVTAGGAQPARRHLPALEESAAHLEQAIVYAPTFINAYLSLVRTRLAEGAVYQNLGNSQRAMASYLAAERQLDATVSLDPTSRQRPDLRDLDRLTRQRLAGVGAAPP